MIHRGIGLAFLVLAAGSLGACQAIDVAVACSTLCEHVRECVDDELSEKTCANKCRDAVDDHDLAEAADDCANCVEDNACAKVADRCDTCNTVLESFTDKRF